VAPHDCLSCGTCCFSELDAYVRVTGEDHARLGDRAGDLVRFIGNRAYMRMEDGHCAALRIEASRAERGRFVCDVYDARPAICRELERGSPQCEGEIATKQDRPKRLLVQISKRRGA
jgi:Fe-S-cluster containining protein